MEKSPGTAFLQDPQTRQRLLILAGLLVLLALYFPINRTVTGGVTPDLPLDARIPLWPIWAVPYLLTLPWWIASLIWGALKMDFPLWQHFAFCLALTIAVSYTTFIFYPTYVVRPEVTGGDFFSRLIAWLYAGDQVNNALPSGHTYTTLIITIFWSRWLPRLKPLWITIAALVLLSTLFTKQHYLLDLVAAAGVVAGGYWFSGYLLRKA